MKKGIFLSFVVVFAVILVAPLIDANQCTPGYGSVRGCDEENKLITYYKNIDCSWERRVVEDCPTKGMACKDGSCYTPKSPSTCGNGVADHSETCIDCPEDVGTCVDTKCATCGGIVDEGEAEAESELEDTYCSNINLKIDKLCYDSNKGKYERNLYLVVNNLGTQEFKTLRIIRVFSDVAISDDIEVRDNEFRDGKTIEGSYYTCYNDPVGSKEETCPLFLDESFISLSLWPYSGFGPCKGKEILANQITDCSTGDQLWPIITQDSQEETGSDKIASGSTNQSLISRTYYLLIGLILVVILVAIIFKIIKRKPKIKEAKEPKKEISPSVEEKKETIPASVSEAVSIRGFTVKYGKSLILDNVDMNVRRGELVCLLGPSGTGKSTVIESLVGRKSPTTGNIKIFGKDIKDKKIFDYVGFVPQHAELYMNQTVEQNLLSSATKWGIKDGKKKIDDILALIGLSQRKELAASKLSGGQIKLLSLGMELIRDPELLILDEPTTGLDPNTRDNIITILSRIVTKQKKTVFFTTHFMDDAEECDEVIILAKGKIAAQGAPSKLEKRLPGNGRVVNVILDNVTDDLLTKIRKIEGVEKIISEGRNLKIITEEPNAVRLAQKIDAVGGIVNKTEITDATMKEVFVYCTGEEVKEG